MKPLQVCLDDAQRARRDAWAGARGWTKSQAIRATVRALAGQGETDPLRALSGMIDGQLPAECHADSARDFATAGFAGRP